ncbi:GH32 C-terminal domain-containing protein [Microbacterium sp. SORGH_AS_0888]|uniref:GH32 C-terminal domain-containing protein n=1 Tax=Microbacterium sp. SORGH_AS_0888 TaxID=3041791 RepID=UPI0027D82573|nr:GH32 C-terminal domain-containing protein [Microbacterium sp. SORGH_AS_0888]
MSLPREVTLVSTADGPRLRQRVVPQLDAQLEHAAAETRAAVALDGDVDLGLAGDVVKIEAVLRPGTASQAGITVFGDATSGTRIGYDADTERVFIDRRASGDVGFHPAFASIDEAPTTLRPDGTIALELYLDRASVELFTEDGRLTITDQVFPNGGADAITAWATGGSATLESITVTPLTPTMWKVPAVPTLDVEATTSPRCMAGKVTVTAQVHNRDTAPVTVSLTTPYGARSVTVDPGKTTSAAFTTRLRSIPAGEMPVVTTAQIDGQPVTVASTAPIDARSC